MLEKALDLKIVLELALIRLGRLAWAKRPVLALRRVLVAVIFLPLLGSRETLGREGPVLHHLGRSAAACPTGWSLMEPKYPFTS